MNTNDKNYVDRLHNQQVNELNEIKNRLLILEGKTTTTTDGNIRVEIDTDKIYEMFLKACHEWRAAIARDYDTFFQKMLGVAKLTDRHYRDIKIALQKILNEPSTDSESPKNQPLFSNLPSDILPKLTALRLRLSNCIRNYLTGNFSLPRGWTLLTILLYSLSFILFLYLIPPHNNYGVKAMKTNNTPVPNNYLFSWKTTRIFAELLANYSLFRVNYSVSSPNYSPTTRFSYHTSAV